MSCQESVRGGDANTNSLKGGLSASACDCGLRVRTRGTVATSEARTTRIPGQADVHKTGSDYALSVIRSPSMKDKKRKPQSRKTGLRESAGNNKSGPPKGAAVCQL